MDTAVSSTRREDRLSPVQWYRSYQNKKLNFMTNHPDAVRWNGRYQTENNYRQQGPPRQLLRDFAHLLPKDGVVLDAAAGLGVNALFVAQQGISVVALDISEVGLRQLQRKAAGMKVEVSTAVFDLTQPYFPANCVDVILNFRFLERAAIAAYKQALRPGGLIIFETFVYEGEGDTPAYFLAPGELVKAFDDFEVIYSVETAVPGHRSGKMRPVAQLIAQKPSPL